MTSPGTYTQFELESLPLYQRLCGLGANYAERFTFDPSKGWALFNTDDPMAMGIECIDDMPDGEGFSGDVAALLHVCELSLQGDTQANQALTLHLMADQLRGMVWGWQHTQRRIAPE